MKNYIHFFKQIFYRVFFYLFENRSITFLISIPIFYVYLGVKYTKYSVLKALNNSYLFQILF